MTFGSTFGRVFSPTFQPKSQAVAGTSSWWLAGGIAAANCVAAYQAKGAASYAASKSNLTLNTDYDLTEVGGGAVDWATSTGWGGFASLSRCLNSGYTPALDLTQSVFVRFSDYSTSNYEVLFGYYKSLGLKGAMLFGPYSDNTMGTFYGADTAIQIAYNAPRMSAGIYGFAGRTPYRDGNADSNTVGTSGALGALTAYIGARNYNDTLNRPFSGNIQAVAIYNTTLTSTQVGLLTTAMAAL